MSVRAVTADVTGSGKVQPWPLLSRLRRQFGGLLKSASTLALAAAAGLYVSGVGSPSAKAADLGGDCCADLEERVAELEATTVRKGNRKVSLEISGQVHRTLLFWDDGDDSDVTEADATLSSSRLNFTGSAKISTDWTVGFRMVWEVDGSTTFSVSQLNDDGGTTEANSGDQRVDVREAHWWIRSDKLGEVQVGRLQPATDNLILFDLGGGVGASNDVSLVGGGFFLRDSTTPGIGGLFLGTTLVDFLPNLDTARREGVMYLSPTIGGFQLLAAWGEDDTWDVAVRYAGEWNNVRVAFGIGYLNDRDDEPDFNSAGAFVGDGNGIDRKEWKGSASAWHIPSGLFVTGAFVHREHDGNGAPDLTVDGQQRPDFDYLYASAGIKKNWFGIGHTSFFGEWAKGQDGITGLAELGLGGAARVTDSDVTVWGVGIAQDIDAAAMELYLIWHHFEFDARGALGPNAASFDIPLEDLDIVFTGARIRF